MLRLLAQLAAVTNLWTLATEAHPESKNFSPDVVVTPSARGDAICSDLHAKNLMTAEPRTFVV